MWYTVSMWVTRRYLSILSKRPIMGSALSLSLLLCGGCLMEPGSVGVEPSEMDSGAKSLRDQSSVNPAGSTGGCAKVWSDAKMDSVVFCPDPKPPKPE